MAAKYITDYAHARRSQIKRCVASWAARRLRRNLSGSCCGQNYNECEIEEVDSWRHCGLLLPDILASPQSIWPVESKRAAAGRDAVNSSADQPPAKLLAKKSGIYVGNSRRLDLFGYGASIPL